MFEDDLLATIDDGYGLDDGLVEGDLECICIPNPEDCENDDCECWICHCVPYAD